MMLRSGHTTSLGPPLEAVGERVIVLGGDGETVEHDLGGSVGNIIIVSIGQKQQPRRAQEPYASQTELDAGEHLHLIGEDSPAVEPAVRVVVLKDQDPIALGQVEVIRSLGVGEILGNQSAARVPGHRNRVSDVRFRGKD